MISTTKWLAAVGCVAIAAAGAAGACKKRVRAPAEEPIVVSSAREDTARAEAAEQSAEDADRWLDQRVEQGLVDVPGLSAMARGVEVEVEGGVVTVRGPVTSDQERALVEAIAIANAGDGNVKSQLQLDPSGRGWAPGGAVVQPPPQQPAPAPAPEQQYVESAPAPAPMPEYAQTYQGPTPTPPMAQPGPLGITTPGTVDTGGVPATEWDAAPPGYYSSYGGYGVPLVVPVAPDVIPTSPLVQGRIDNTQPGLTVPGEQVVIPGSSGIVQGTTAPSSTGISPGSVRMGPTIPGPSIQPGFVTQPTPTPFNSSISPTNPGMNTPTTANPAPMGPGTGNTGVAPALVPAPPSRPVVVRPLNR